MATIHPPVENQAQRIEQWRSSIESILRSQAEQLYHYGDVTIHLIISSDNNHYLLVHEGWEDGCRIHGTIVHIEIRDHQIWIHFDGTEEGIAEALVANGIDKEHIILAFQPPHLRPHSGYGIEQKMEPPHVGTA
jgi:hypothetical protein